MGSTHAELVDSAELVLNLAPPGALTDTSWIKPGKVFRCELTTAAGLAGVDYIEYDAGWYGPEFTTPDATKPIAAIDLPSVNVDHSIHHHRHQATDQVVTERDEAVGNRRSRPGSRCGAAG